MPIPFRAAQGLWKQIAGLSGDTGCGVSIQILQSGHLDPQFPSASGVPIVPSVLGYPVVGASSGESFPGTALSWSEGHNQTTELMK